MFSWLAALQTLSCTLDTSSSTPSPEVRQTWSLRSGLFKCPVDEGVNPAQWLNLHLGDQREKKSHLTSREKGHASHTSNQRTWSRAPAMILSDPSLGLQWGQASHGFFPIRTEHCRTSKTGHSWECKTPLVSTYGFKTPWGPCWTFLDHTIVSDLSVQPSFPLFVHYPCTVIKRISQPSPSPFSLKAISLITFLCVFNPILASKFWRSWINKDFVTFQPLK